MSVSPVADFSPVHMEPVDPPMQSLQSDKIADLAQSILSSSQEREDSIALNAAPYSIESLLEMGKTALIINGTNMETLLLLLALEVLQGVEVEKTVDRLEDFIRTSEECPRFNAFALCALHLLRRESLELEEKLLNAWMERFGTDLIETDFNLFFSYLAFTGNAPLANKSLEKYEECFNQLTDNFQRKDLIKGMMPIWALKKLCQVELLEDLFTKMDSLDIEFENRSKAFFERVLKELPSLLDPSTYVLLKMQCGCSEEDLLSELESDEKVLALDTLAALHSFSNPSYANDLLEQAVHLSGGSHEHSIEKATDKGTYTTSALPYAGIKRLIAFGSVIENLPFIILGLINETPRASLKKLVDLVFDTFDLDGKAPNGLDTKRLTTADLLDWLDWFNSGLMSLSQ